MTINTCQQLESALIGSILTSPDKIISISDIVKPTDFTDERAMVSFVAIVDEYRKSKAVNITTISAAQPKLIKYLSECLNQSFPPGVKKFASDIAYRAKIRRMSTGLNALSRSTTPEEMLAGMMDIYNKEVTTGEKSADIKSVMTRFDSLVSRNRTGKGFGFSTGFDIHEELYYKYFPGHIWTVGGFTSVGKTAVMVQKICNLLGNGENANIIIISTEMSEEQVVARILSNFTGVTSVRILAGNYHSAEEEEKVFLAMKSLKTMPIKIYDSIYKVNDIENVFRKAKIQNSVDVGFIDYVQNCKNPDAKSEYQEQADMAKRFQVLAKDINATLVCLSQVSNDVGRGNTDQLELKGAGEWAAVSDIGVMLKRHPSEKHRLKYMIKKNRHGALAECELHFEDVYTRLSEHTE